MSDLTLQNYAHDLLVTCGTPPYLEPFFVFLRPTALPRDSVPHFADQILNSYLNLLTAFTAPRPRPNQCQRAINNFVTHAVPVFISAGQELRFVSTGAPPNTTILRLPLSILHTFLTSLTVRGFTAAQNRRALCFALSHIAKCTVDYTSENQFVIPPIAAMPAQQPHLPMLTLTPTLPVFSGSPDDDILVFIQRLDRLLAVYPNVTWEQKLFCLENQVRNGPLTCVQRELQFLADHPPNGVRPTPEQIYTHVKDCLIKSYTTDQDEQKYKDELSSRVKKDSESLNDYVQSILELCRKAKIRHLPEKLRYMHAGLPLILANSLRPNDYTDVPTFLTIVQKLESTQRATLRAHTQHALQTGQSLQYVVPSYAQVTAAPTTQPAPAPASAPTPPPPAQVSDAAAQTLLDTLIAKLQNMPSLTKN